MGVIGRRLFVNIDSDVLDIVTAGLQFGYTLTDTRSGLRRWFSQLTISAVFTLSLFAGDYR
jgi:hypothetical protein